MIVVAEDGKKTRKPNALSDRRPRYRLLAGLGGKVLSLRSLSLSLVAVNLLVFVRVSSFCTTCMLLSSPFGEFNLLSRATERGRRFSLGREFLTISLSVNIPTYTRARERGRLLGSRHQPTKLKAAVARFFIGCTWSSS